MPTQICGHHRDLQPTGNLCAAFTASDSELTTSDDLTIDVFPSNLPPVVNAGADQFITVNFSGKIVACHDDWTLSDYAFNNATRQFALNLADYFTGGKPGKFLVYSLSTALSHPLTGTNLAATMMAAGHSWTVSRSVDFRCPISCNTMRSIWRAMRRTIWS